MTDSLGAAVTKARMYLSGIPVSHIRSHKGLLRLTGPSLACSFDHSHRIGGPDTRTLTESVYSSAKVTGGDCGKGRGCGASYTTIGSYVLHRYGVTVDDRIRSH